MTEFFNSLERIQDSIFTVAGFSQVVVIALGLVAAWFVARAARSHVTADLEPGALKFAAGGFNRVAFPLVALALTWLAKTLLATWLPVDLLNLAVPLIGSFAAIRVLVYLVRHLFPPSALLRASELVIVCGMWSIAALYLSGLLPQVKQSLSSFSITVGTQEVTLLLVLNGLFMVLFALLIAVTLARLVEQRIMAQETISFSMRLVLTKLMRAIALLVAVLLALPMVGIDLTVLSVFGGAVGVGLGLGLQKVASNYVCGFIILLEKSIRVGDIVTVDSRYGTITSINGRYSVLRSLDGTESLLPNETLITGTVINHTFSDPIILLKVPLSVAYGTDLDLVEGLLLEVARQQPRVLADPGPSMSMRSMADSGIDLDLVVWIRDAELGQAKLKSDILRATWRAFVTADIQVPFPQREVRILNPNAYPPATNT